MKLRIAVATPLVSEVARLYLSARGRPLLPRRAVLLPASPLLGRRLAAHYDAARHSPLDAATRESYGALKDETVEQFLHLAALIRIEPWTDPSREQPYANSSEMFADVVRGRLFIFLGGDLPPDHPMAADSGVRLSGVSLTFNHLFRAVYDVFGHALYRLSFGPNGEEGAWQVHASMYPREALAALTTETCAQNAHFNFGPHTHLPVEKRPYPDQKACLPPPECCVPTPLLGVRTAG